VGASELEGLSPGEYLVAVPPEGAPVHVVREEDVGPTAFDLIAEVESLREIWSRLVDAGGMPMGQGVWETLRIEKGRPAFGIDMDESTIPLEAGIQARAIDDGKGCYTGQEVIVRIRDRGKVNWLLRGLRLGDVPSPATGAGLFREGEEKVVGRITSSAQSPAFGETIALGYVRSEVEVESEVRLGAPTGAPVLVMEVNDEGWAPARGSG
jgi:folate-binding protein YgfZ